MNIDDIKRKVESEEYHFLREKPLGNNIIILGLGGSHAYGTNNENSDIDVRGVATHSPEDILTRKGFDQVVNEATDTTVYSLEKIVNLLSNCNPNTIEILGLEPWQYLYITDIGQALIDNRDMFLSKRAIHSFGGYASQQLWRLNQIAVRYVGQQQQEKHILESIESARYTYPEKYFNYPEDSIKLYVDKAVNEEYDTEIFMDINLTHYPLRDYKSMWSEMNNVVKDYSKIGKRNKRAIDKDKLGKHMCHLVRLYLMLFDILEKGEINTYRKNDKDFLIEIRNGKFLNEEKQPVDEFYDLVNEYESRLNYLKDHTDLPDNPDYKRINKFLADANWSVLDGNYKIS